MKKYVTAIQNITVVEPEVLLILKQGAEFERKDSVKGIKDQVDIMTLILNIDIDFKKYYELLKKYNLEHYFKRLKSILLNFKELKYVDLNPREFKVKKKEILGKIG